MIYNVVYMVDCANDFGKIYRCNIINSTPTHFTVSNPLYGKITIYQTIDMTFRGYAYFFGFKEAKLKSKEVIHNRLQKIKEMEQNIAVEKQTLNDRRKHYDSMNNQ